MVPGFYCPEERTATPVPCPDSAICPGGTPQYEMCPTLYTNNDDFTVRPPGAAIAAPRRKCDRLITRGGVRAGVDRGNAQECIPSGTMYLMIGTVGALLLIAIITVAVLRLRKRPDDVPAPSASERTPLLPDSEVKETNPGPVYTGL